MIEYRNLRVAILGGGSVGAQVASLLLEHGDELAQRAGAGLELVGVAVRDLDAPRTVDLPKDLLTTDADALILGADIVIELMGGIEPARSYILQAINSGADVVTANKALLAQHGAELFEAADRSVPSSTTRPPSPAPSRSCVRCATASRGTGSTASSAS